MDRRYYVDGTWRNFPRPVILVVLNYNEGNFIARHELGFYKHEFVMIRTDEDSSWHRLAGREIHEGDIIFAGRYAEGRWWPRIRDELNARMIRLTVHERIARRLLRAGPSFPIGG